MRLVAEQIRGIPIQEALDRLTFLRKSAARDMLKLLKSAVANADQKGGIDVDNLLVKTVLVDQGTTMRRFLPRARGSASRINKKTSHIKVVLEET